MTKEKKAIIQKAINALLKAAIAQDDLAKTYRALEWTLAAERAETEARDLRGRAERMGPDSDLWK